MKTKTIKSQTMRTLFLLLLLVSGFAYAQPPINNPTPYAVCDDNNDGVSCSFMLSTKDAEISTQPDIQIWYYLTLTDSQTGANPIPKNSAYCNINSPNSQTIFVRAWDPAAPALASYTTLSLMVNPLPTANQAPDMVQYENPFDGIAVFNLTNQIGYIVASGTDVVTFYTSVADAQANVNPIANPSAYVNLSNPQTIGVRVRNPATGCSSVTSFNLVVNASNIVTPTPYAICDDNNDGQATFDLTTKNTEILGALNPSDYTITYYADATFFTPIGNPSNLVTSSTTVYCRVVENANTSNISTTHFNLVVNPLPQTVVTIPNLIVSENPFDGVATFDLTVNEGFIMQGQIGFSFNYYHTQADAISEVNPIVTPTSYTGSHQEYIWITIKNTITGCSKVVSFQLLVYDSTLIVNIPDANFKARLITIGVDTNTDGNIQFSEAAAVNTELNVNSSLIADITGFEAFTNVPSFKCVANNITSINLSNLPNLKTFECGLNSNLTSLNLTNLVGLDTLKTYSTNLSLLNVSNLTSLKYLDCSYNHITNLNVSNLTNLKVLNCASNWLPSLDVTALIQLEEFNCSMNQLTTINVSPLVNLKTLICSNNQINTLNVNNLPNLEHLEYGNNQSTFLTFSNLPNMKYLDCSGNNLASLDASMLTLLEHLNCGGNSLTTLNVNGLTHLNYLACSVNQLSTINVSSLTNLNYLNCLSNQLTTLNLSGLSHLVTVYASNNSITATDLTNLPSLTTVYFDYNQLSSLNLTGSNNVSLLMINNNVLTNLALTGLVNLSWLDCHENHLTTVAFNGLSNLQTVLCDHNNLTGLDFSTCPMLQNLSCSYNALTSINIKNGYPYINTNNFWHENPNLTFVCADEDELGNVTQILNQSINVNNGNVVYNTYCSFTPGGNYNTITGVIRLDSNNNGCDATDATLPMIKVNINDGINQGATFTDANGIYKFYTQAGFFTITPEIENNLFNFTPTSSSVTFVDNNNNTANYNYCMTPNGVQSDIEVILQPLTPARPGFDATYKIVYRNKGNVTLTDSINFQFESSKAQFVSATPSPNVFLSANEIAWNYSNLLPFEEKTIILTLHINASTNTNPVNIGDVLNFITFSIPLGLSDLTPEDNGYVQLHQTVVGSYDPNGITCLEGDILPTSAIGQYLHYGITFENTGNYYAENVVVKDIIDTTKYDVNSIQLLNTSHPVYTRITGNVVEFIFENINLAATSGNPPVGGHGDVLFKIRSLSNLVSGDVAIKSAKIFFDYNAPIDTNMAETTYSNLNNSIFQLDTNVSVAPNPTHGIVSINSKFDIQSMELFDAQGRILETSIENNTSAKLDISGKQNGIYFLKITTEKGSKVEKIVKE